MGLLIVLGCATIYVCRQPIYRLIDNAVEFCHKLNWFTSDCATLSKRFVHCTDGKWRANVYVIWWTEAEQCWSIAIEHWNELRGISIPVGELSFIGAEGFVQRFITTVYESKGPETASLMPKI